MHVTLLDQRCIINDGRHAAFPSICQWHGHTYIAARLAMTHGIVPPGVITIWQSHAEPPCGGREAAFWPSATLDFPQGDLRDPKLIPSDAALYCLAGCYLAHPATLQYSAGLSSQAPGNILQTMITYTTDGLTWSPWSPILRPNYWLWSVLALPQGWLVAAYHHGQVGEAQSVALWGGKSLFSLTPQGTIYEGASFVRDGKTLRYPSLTPCEPVLYQIDENTLGCLVRTGSQMEIGVSRSNTSYQKWRWQEVQGLGDDILHASSILQTPHGWLMGARHIQPQYKVSHAYFEEEKEVSTYTASTRLYTLHGTHAEEVCRLESAGDCAYPSLCPGPEAGTYRVAHYSQHAHEKAERYGITLPGAGLYMATVRVEDSPL